MKKSIRNEGIQEDEEKNSNMWSSSYAVITGMWRCATRRI